MEDSKAQVVWLWLDHHTFGCGWRRYVAIVGRKWVRLTLIASGEHAKILLSEFEAASRRQLTIYKPLDATKARRALRRNAKVYGNVDRPAVKDALTALKG